MSTMSVIAKVLCVVAVFSVFAAGAAPSVRLGETEVDFRLHLGLPRVAGMDVSAREMASLSVATNGGAVVASWKGHPAVGADFTVRATFVARDGGWEYSFSWEGLDAGRLHVESVDFPDVTVPRTDASGILHPGAHGMGIVRRPDWAALPEDGSVAKAEARTFQFVALLDDAQGGWYVDARDGAVRPKTAHAFRAGDRARLCVDYGVPSTDENTRRYALPWKGVITPFRGGWWEAAAVYRPWAREQAWFKGAMRRRQSPQAKRLREIALWAWNRGPSAEVSPPVERFVAETGLPCALDWYWWHMPSYDTSYPNFWPPREGEKAFCETIRRLRGKGVYTMAYLNGMSQDMDDPVWADGGDDEGVMRHDLEIAGTAYNVYTGHRLVPMCGEAPRFHSRLANQVSRLSSAGLDAVYLDQISCATGLRCWHPRHRHLPGDAAARQSAYRDFVGRVRKENPGLALSSEECSEAFVDAFDSFISLFGPSYERCGVGVGPEVEAVPVWNALYHGAIACFGTYSLLDGVPPWDERWPTDKRWKAADEKDWYALFPDQFPVEFARTVVWGNQPSVHAFRLSHATDPKYARAYAFMKETARFYFDHRDFLFDGELLSPGRLDCRTQKVAFLQRGIYSPAGGFSSVEQPALPTVFHNVWRTPDGRTAAILVNWSRSEQEWELDCPTGRAKGRLAPLSWTAVSEFKANKEQGK